MAHKEWLRDQVAYAAHKIQVAVAALDRADRVLAEITERAGEYERLDNRILPDEVFHAQQHLHRMTRRRAG